MLHAPVAKLAPIMARSRNRQRPVTLLFVLRRQRGMTQAQVAGAAVPPCYPQEVDRLEKGATKLTEKWARRIAPAFNIAPEDLISGRRSVRLELNIATAFTESRPDFDIPEAERRWLDAPLGLDRPEQCFAALVADDSADRLYPPGSTLFVRRIAELDEPLSPGLRVVVRRHSDSTATFEVLAGQIGLSPAGDIVLFTRSSNREVPISVVVQEAPRAGGGLADRLVRFVPQAEAIDYEPRPGDPAEILGIVEFATTRER